MNGSLFLNKTYSRNELKGLLEAVLFVNGKAVQVPELQRVFEADRQEIDSMIEEMNAEYRERKSGFTIVPVAGGYQLLSSPAYQAELAELFGKRNETSLPKSALETLAIIAYKQPISKEEVDKIRGVSCTRSINTLLALKFISITGAADDIVKSPLYSTTSRFLEFFKIQSLEDLPALSTIDLSQFNDSELDIAEEEGSEENDATPKSPEADSIFSQE